MFNTPSSGTMSSAWSLEKLIAPVSAKDFVSAYQERRFLYSANHSGRDLGALFQVSDLETLVCQMHGFGEIKTAGGRAGGKEATNSAPREDAPMGRLYGNYINGKTIVVNGIHRRWEPVRRLCAALSAELAMVLQCNLYVTPASAQGFDCHWDGHDVLVLQVGGSKDWTLYPMIETPPAPDAEGKSISPDSKPLKQLKLRAGDVLYIPRGMPHVAQTASDSSAHLTIGLIGVTWRDVMHAAVHVVAQTRQEMRQVLPSDWLGDGIAGHCVPGAYRDAAAALADEDVLFRALDLVAAQLISEVPAPSEGHFLSLDLVDAITVDTQLIRYSGALVRSIVGDDDITLHFPGGKITSAIKALWAFSFFVDTQSFRVGDIPGWYSDEERLILARNLVRAGMYSISRLSQHDTSQVRPAQSGGGAE